MSRRENMGNAFDQSSSYDAGKVDSDIFGMASPRSTKKVAEPIQVDLIWPDLTQPRRPIPHAIKKQWNGNPNTIGRLLQQWINEITITISMRQELDITGLIQGNEGDLFIEMSENPNAKIKRFAQVLALASSIYQHGLANPVAVARSGGGYKLIAGERRWLAYQLLKATLGDDWAFIPAFVKPSNVWEQAIENTQREDLNPIQMARQFALLIMQARKEAHDETFADIATFNHEREFYAQVLDVQVPQGYSEKIGNALNIFSRSRQSEIKSLLRMTNENWDEADANDWAYSHINGQGLIPRIQAPPPKRAAPTGDFTATKPDYLTRRRQPVAYPQTEEAPEPQRTAYSITDKQPVGDWETESPDVEERPTVEKLESGSNGGGGNLTDYTIRNTGLDQLIKFANDDEWFEQFNNPKEAKLKVLVAIADRVRTRWNNAFVDINNALREIEGITAEHLAYLNIVNENILQDLHGWPFDVTEAMYYAVPEIGKKLEIIAQMIESRIGESDDD